MLVNIHLNCLGLDVHVQLAGVGMKICALNRTPKYLILIYPTLKGLKSGKLKRLARMRFPSNGRMDILMGYLIGVTCEVYVRVRYAARVLELV